jgi:hypothetical protein
LQGVHGVRAWRCRDRQDVQTETAQRKSKDFIYDGRREGMILVLLPPLMFIMWMLSRIDSHLEKIIKNTERKEK